MKTRTKPLMFAVALALGASAPAFADSGASGASGAAAAADSGGSTNSMTAPARNAPGAPVTSGMTGAPLYSGAPAISPDEEHGGLRNRMSRDADEEHGGLRNRMSRDADEEHGGLRSRASDAYAAPAADNAPGVAPAPPAARSEEEHGGLRNRLHAKKERTRERLGLGPDHD